MVAPGRVEEAATNLLETELVTRDDTEVRFARGSAVRIAPERYELGQLIGKGGMGEVMAAYDGQVGREVAVKRLRSADPDAVTLERFLREARIQGRLAHPAIPAVHEIGRDPSGRPFFVMTRVAGVTLSKELRDGCRPRHELLRAFVGVCRAIELAHANGIVHRDLKPANVVIGEHGAVYVLDWGIALDVTAPPCMREVAGTPGYMAPEQQRAEAGVDARADVYSLGCVLYEILTRERFSPATPVRDDVPPELERAYRRATSPVRALRTPSVTALADAVEAYLDGDRDLAFRRQLAEQHLARAQAAITGSLDEASHATAIREAGRALALDPTLEGAVDLVGRLMLAPPLDTPREVTVELDALGRAEDRSHLRLAARANALVLLILPLVWLLGVHDAAYLGTYAGLLVTTIAMQLWGARSMVGFRIGGPVALVLAAGIVFMLARMFTPFLIAPGVIVVAIMSFSLSSLAQRRWVVAGTAGVCVAMLVLEYVLEQAGVLSLTTWVDHGALVMRSPLAGIADFPMIPMLLGYIVALISIACSTASAIARMHRRSREQLQIQAWQLRQLL